LIYRQLAASETRQDQVRPATRVSAVLNTVGALRMLSNADLAELERNMRLNAFQSHEVILAAGVVPEALYIIESGIVSVSIERPEGWVEVGRMGPGELMGETGFVDQSPAVGRFCALTDCMVYRIALADLEPWLKDHPELRGALAGLARFRAKARAAMLTNKPTAPDPNGFLKWLRKGVTRFQAPREPRKTDKLS
jgi:CRP-like cAMP-binding protein